jgi:hypothetical protein
VWVLHTGASGRKQTAGLLPSPMKWERGENTRHLVPHLTAPTWVALPLAGEGSYGSAGISPEIDPHESRMNQKISVPRRRASLGMKRSKAGTLRAFLTTDRASYRRTYSTNL